MDTLLRSLKVPDLKLVLTQTALPTSGKKDELVQRILDSPQALETAQKLHGGVAQADGQGAAVATSSGAIEEENLMPPDEFDWGDDGKVGAE